MQIPYLKVARESGRGKIDKEQKKNMPREQGLLLFLEELESISIMNTGLSEKKSKGRPEDGELKDRKIEEMKIWKHFAGEYICKAISVHLPHEQTDKKS